MSLTTATCNWCFLFLLLLLPVGSRAQDAGVRHTAGVVADVNSCLLKPKQQIKLGSPVFGALAAVFVDRASVVTQGQIVAKLDTSVDEAQLRIDTLRAGNTTASESIEADLAWNERELARRRKLLGNMFSKANDIDEVQTKIAQDKIALRKAEIDREQARLEAARSQAQLQLKLLRAPFDGVVTELRLHAGEFIYEQTPVMDIAQLDPLIVDVILPSDKYRLVRLGMIGEVTLHTPVDAVREARVDAIDPVVDAASDTFRVRLALPNPGNRIPAGIRCSVMLPALMLSQ